jgi:hypothetical protein
VSTHGKQRWRNSASKLRKRKTQKNFCSLRRKSFASHSPGDRYRLISSLASKGMISASALFPAQESRASTGRLGPILHSARVRNART